MKAPVLALSLLATAASVFLPTQALAQSGLISGVVLDVQTPEGEPAENVPISLVGASGSAPIATTGSTGSASVPYTSTPTSPLAGTRIVILGVTVAGGMKIALVPEGETLEECEDAQNQQQTDCEELGAIVWGRTARALARFGARYGNAHPSTHRTFYGGPTLMRTRELGAFGFGADFAVQVAPAFTNGSWIASGSVRRFGLTNSTVWVAEVEGGVQVPVRPHLAFRATGGLALDHTSYEMTSGGTQTVYTLASGVVLSFPQSPLSILVEAGVTGRRNTQDLGLSTGVLWTR